MTSPQLSISEAVAAFNVERRTLQRFVATGKLPGATKGVGGRWLIPVESLHSLGFTARATWRTDTPTVATDHDNDARALRQRISELEQQLELTRQGRDAESRLREAAERNANDLRASLRMLEQTPTATAAPQRWWQRRGSR